MEPVGLLFVATTFLLLVGQAADELRASRPRAAAFDRLQTIWALTTDPILEALLAAPELQPRI